MKSNKGQALVSFVIVFPILLLILVGLIDIGNVYYEKNKLNNINKTVIKEGLKSNLDNDKLYELIKNNDIDIDITKLNVTNEEIEINLAINKSGIFNKIIGIENYKIVSKYEGNIKNKEIKRIK